MQKIGSILNVPMYQKEEDTRLYTVYVSFDGKNKTVYNKQTHEINRVYDPRGYPYKRRK